jgi:membrane-bound lytic murein transglycosylase MltF
MMLMNMRQQAHRLVRPSTRVGAAIVTIAALAFGLIAGPISAAAEEKPSTPAPQREQLTIAPEEATAPWTGDLDGMIKRGFIRVLTVYSKTFYFVDKGVQRGAAYDAGNLFVEDLNKKLAKDKKLGHKHLKVRALFIPVGRGELLPALAAGKGDIAMAGLGVTEERQTLVDFSTPMLPNVSVFIVSGPASPAISGVDDLAGKQVFVRRSSVYYELLTALNQRFAAEKKPAVVIKEAPEELEDEDLLEMVNAGLIPFTATADFYMDKALFAFASYNAGAGRISQLRKEAAKRGLDPNVWFHNVEYVAAEKIGAETVTYVSNIFKYYIGYHLIMEAKAEREQAVEKIKGESQGAP